MRTARAPRAAELLLGSYRRRVLSALLSRPDESFYVRQLARLTRVPAGSLHRELKLLASAGLLIRSTSGNQVRYQADPDCPIRHELAAVLGAATSRPVAVAETAPSGRAAYQIASHPPRHESRTATDIVTDRQAEVAALCRRFRVRRLDLFGSAARGTFDAARSDLDFVVTFEELHPVALADAWFGLREGLAALFGRPVDLLTAESIRNAYLRESIERHHRTLYAA